MEEWRDVYGFEGYYKISNTGRVKSLERMKHTPGTTTQYKIKEKELKPWLHGDGYYIVELWKDGKRSPKRIHVLIMEAFVCPRPEGMDCCHNDGNRTNNDLSNLRWDTRKSNCEDAIKQGTFIRGNKCWKSKLKECEVLLIRELWSKGIKQKILSKMFKVDESAIYSIVRRINWKHI